MLQGPRTVAAGLLAGLTLALCGCSGNSDAGLPAATAPTAGATTTTTSAPTSASPTSSSPNGLPATAISKPGKVTVSGPQGQAVNAAWQLYWQTRMTGYGAAKFDATAMSRVSSGRAYSLVAAYIGGLRAKKTHTVGTLTVNVSGAHVSGTAATITSCILDLSVNVDSKGRPTETPAGHVGFVGTLRKTDASWKVTALKLTAGACA